MENLIVKTGRREEFIAVTRMLEEMCARKGWQDGMLQLHCPHTTAGLTINENADPDVTRDILMTLSKLVPLSGGYRHAEGNSDAHVKASLMGSGLALMVEAGRILLGTWQGVFFCEFDGPRTRQLWVRWVGTRQTPEAENLSGKSALNQGGQRARQFAKDYAGSHEIAVEAPLPSGEPDQKSQQHASRDAAKNHAS